MKKNKFKASSLRAIMIFFVVVMSVFVIGGFYYTQGWLGNFANEVKATNLSLSNNTDPAVQAQLNSTLSSQKVAVDKASSIVLPNLNYQNAVKQDINHYSSVTGVKITDISETQPPSDLKTLTIDGTQSRYFKITIENPVLYINLIKFTKALETNIPVIRLTGISISHTVSLKDSVTVSPIIIEVYTK